MTKFILYTFMMITSVFPIHAQLVINEFMQSNIDCVMDDLNNFPDSWVELYNTGSLHVQLREYRIGKTEDPNSAWQLPDTIIKPKGHLVIFCDEEAHRLHTDFKLSTSKNGSLFLFKGNSIIHAIRNIKKQPAPNISVGCRTDGEIQSIVNFCTPTPNAANIPETGISVLGDPIFSEEGRVITDNMPITLTLEMPEGTPSPAVIIYTTDGSEPTAYSNVYEEPITIDTTCIIRAKIICHDYLSPRAKTQSYIFFPRALTLPVVSIVSDSNYFYNPEIGILVNGNGEVGEENWRNDWRRPVNMEFFESADRSTCINQLCEARIAGGISRIMKRKSLAIYAKKGMGTEFLNYEFFPDQKPGLDIFKSIVLRNAGNDFEYLYMRDAIIQQSIAPYVDLDWQAYRPAIIYLNGEYYGMLNIRERSNEDNIYSNYNGLEDIDLFENWTMLKKGDWNNLWNFTTFYQQSGHTLEEYAQYIDWEEFWNLMIMDLFYDNTDFPYNNIVMWRHRGSNGRWRFIAKDTDRGLGLFNSKADFNTIRWLNDPSYDPTRFGGNQEKGTLLFRHMMEDEDLKNQFLYRAAIYMGDFLNFKTIKPLWDSMYEAIKYEYPYHLAAIGTTFDYEKEMAWARQWLSERNDHFYNMLSDFYEMGAPTPLRINTNVNKVFLAKTKILFNDIELSKGTFDGKFYQNSPVTLKAIRQGNRDVIRWCVIKQSEQGRVSREIFEGNTCSFVMPQCKLLNIYAVWGEATGIETIHENEHDKPNISTDGNILNITDIEKGQLVTIYDLAGKVLYRQIAASHEVTIPLTSKGILLIKTGNHVCKILH